MSTKNTKKNKTTLAAASSSLHETATGSEEKYKEQVSINLGFKIISLLVIDSSMHENEIRLVIIVIGFQKLIDPAKLSARYQKMGLEGPSDTTYRSIVKTRSQYNNQIAISRPSRFDQAGKGKC